MTNKTRGRTPPTATPTPTVADILGTTDPAHQVQRAQWLTQHAQPTYTMVIQAGPAGFVLTPIGPALPADVAYQMLQAAEDQVRNEERAITQRQAERAIEERVAARLQASAPTASAEAAAAAAPDPSIEEPAPA